jgi:hypothetical protein
MAKKVNEELNLTEVENDETKLQEKTNQLITDLEKTSVTAKELALLRRKNKLSDSRVGNISRELTQLAKIARRYVEN